ncbi:MAG: Xaa-Pro dipeptidase [Solirubrobacteraceae bacterium]
MRSGIDPVAIAAAADADCFICLFDGVHSFLEPEPVLELTGFKALDECAVVVDRAGAMTMVVTPAWDAGRARAPRAPARGGPRVIGSDDALDALVAEVAGRRIAVAGLDAVPERYAQRLGKVAHVVAVDDAVYRRERPKTSDELARARRAATIAEDAYRRLLAEVRPGAAEHQLAARLNADVRRAGADDFFLGFSADRVGRRLRQPTERRLSEGDVVNVEVSPSVEGQFVQICRTVVVGQATTAQRREYALLAAAFAAGLAAAIPGTTVGQVVAAIDQPLAEAGLGEYTRPPHIRVRGHGLGLASTSPGDIAFDSATVLEEGMAFVLHPNQPLPTLGYVLCGEPVVIRAQGAQPLTRTAPHLDATALGQTTD